MTEIRKTSFNDFTPDKGFSFRQPLQLTPKEVSTLNKQDSFIKNNLLSAPGNFDKITASKDFKTVFPNFDILDKSTQKEMVTKVELYMQKYPDFLSKLANINNPEYGKGFQYFFVPEKEHHGYKASPGIEVIDKAMGNSSSGIVFGGTDGVLENSILKNPVAKITHKALSTDMIKGDRIHLDVGGMYTYSSDNTFAHEMAHIVHSYFLTNNERLELWTLYIEASEKNQFLNDYSTTNHMEFFADGVEEYLKQDYQGKFTGRETLKEADPKLYNFVAKVIDPNIKRGEAQSTLKSIAVISEYGAENLYQVSKTFINDKAGKVKKLLGL